MVLNHYLHDHFSASVFPRLSNTKTF
jgi:hypothetical protein